MAFPTGPANGQTTTINGVIYTYNDANGTWSVTSTGTGTIGGSLSLTGNLTAANINATTSLTQANVAPATTGKAIAMSIVFGG